MHPRNKFCNNPADFGELAEFRPALKPYLIEKHSGKEGRVGSCEFQYTLDFSNPLAVRELTCAVLERDFNLKMEIPSGVLVPIVPQKLNYIHWIEDLIAPVGVAEAGVPLVPKVEDIAGIDIGTGTSCIYPLLGCRLNDWHFKATDVSKVAVKCAEKNVEVNDLQDRIEVLQVREGTILEDVLLPGTKQYTFTMCNPPFFKSREDRLGKDGSRSDLRPVPSTCSSGTEKETITEGGEVEFVRRILRDSLRFKSRVRWYTSMLGKKSSLKEIMKELRTNEVPVATSTEFVQGKTWRWGVAWSFDSDLKTKVAELQLASRKRHQLASCEILQLPVKGRGDSLPVAGPAGLKETWAWLNKQLDELKIERELLESRCISCSGVSVECGCGGAAGRCGGAAGGCGGAAGGCDVAVAGGDEGCGAGAGGCGGNEGCGGRLLVYQCWAHEATWSHQRRKRRLLQKLSALSAESNLALKQPSSNTTDGASNSDEIQKKLEKELEGLSPPCDVQFTCSVALVAADEMNRNTKKRKTKKETDSGSCGGSRGETVAVELQWNGEDGDKDQLHQIGQYLRNKMNITNFSEPETALIK